MALEERIVAWSKGRPAWQRETMRKAAIGELLSDADYDCLVADIVAPGSGPKVDFGLEHFPKIAADDPSVRLVSITKTEHLNALASDQPLTFAPDGLTIVYGDNGSGKSGYARLLKRITRARHQEDVLSDVFRDTAVQKPTASLLVRIGDQDSGIVWPKTKRPELQRMRFYDGACTEAYIAAESDFPYRPSALVVMDGLINACVAVRSRINRRLVGITRSAVPLPYVSNDVLSTDAGTFLRGFSANSSIKTLNKLIAQFDESPKTIKELKSEESLLRNADRSKERQRLSRRAEKLDAVCSHLKKLHSVLADDALTALKGSRDTVETLQIAANHLARLFDLEPLSGVGSAPWKALWESARRFSEEQAYPEHSFPVSRGDSRCVLCQQTLDAEGQSRLSRFEAFVRDDTQTRLGETRRFHKVQAEDVSKLTIAPEAVDGNLRDLESFHADLIQDVRTLLSKYKSKRCADPTFLSVSH